MDVQQVRGVAVAVHWPKLSIIIPVFNEAPLIQRVLTSLDTLKRQVPLEIEVIVVDGGSTDNTPAVAHSLCDKVLHVSKGRALQMNAGAYASKGEYLLFLHADTSLPTDTATFVERLIEKQSVWGFFALKLSGASRIFRVIEWCINQRSRISAVGTGDQGLCIRRDIFVKLQGFNEMPLLEDVSMSKRLRKIARPMVWKSPVITSSRRWEKHGVVKIILLMWLLRLSYFLGVNTRYLSRLYS